MSITKQLFIRRQCPKTDQDAVDATMDYELDGAPPSEQEERMLLELLGDDQTRNVLYVEIGPRTNFTASFGEVR